MPRSATRSKFRPAALATVATLTLSFGASGANPSATYLFNDTLGAQQPGVASFSAVDPLGLAAFEDAVVFGQSRRVYHWNGAATPIENQGGLILSTAGLVQNDNYSAELVFRFFDQENNWRRIIDVLNRSDDSGFYVDPSNVLNVFPTGSGVGTFTTGDFHHVVLTVAPDGTTNAYLDGGLALTLNTTVLHISAANLMALFIDNNLGGSFQNEWSSGQIALFRLYGGQLTAGEVATLAQDPFIPSPAAPGLLVAGLWSGLSRRRR